MCLSWRHVGAAFLRNWFSLHCRGASALHLLRDLATTADLPPNSALFSQQLLDLTHRSSEREDTTWTLATSTSWQPQSISMLSCARRGIQDPVPHQPRPSAACSPTGRSAHSPCCTPRQAPAPQRSIAALSLEQFRKLSQRNIVSWGQSTTSLAPTRQQLGSKSSSSASPCGVSSSFSCLSARSFH